nr:hypothetical protein [Bacilli bacterium]
MTSNTTVDFKDKKIKTINFLSSEFLYYPISNVSTKFYIDSKSDIFKEQLLYSSNGKNYYSSVSGKALGTKEIGGKNYLVVQNNYKEKYETAKSLRKNINKLSKKEILEILKSSDCQNYTANINYFINNFDKIDSLVLSLMTCEDSENVYSLIFNEHNSDILEIFDALSQIFDITNPVIIIS